MGTFAIFAVLITFTALLSWINERFVKLPQAIGVMAGALVFSLLFTGLGLLGVEVFESAARSLFERVDFGAVLMKGMLSFLLFAGSLHVNLADLLDRKWSILLLSTFGVLTSTFLVGSLAYVLLGAMGLAVPYGWALLFGALISPTDPIAVLGILRKANAPKLLESTVVGESLFNDGVGVVVFSVIAGVVAGGHEVSGVGALGLFAQEAVGGVVFGLLIGYIAYRLLRTVDNYTVEILLTLALVCGGYALAGALHTSGPLAMVVAGLFIGNHGRLLGMSEASRERLDSFWELLDEILNALLFVMIGLEVLVLESGSKAWLVGLATIPVVLGVRFACVAVPVKLLGRLEIARSGTILLLTWGGIRGGISIALALSLPATQYRSVLLIATYVIVVFSILVQGLTVGRAVRWVESRT